MKSKYNYLKNKIRGSRSARYVALAIVPAVVFASVGVTYAFGGGAPAGLGDKFGGAGEEMFLTTDQLAADQAAIFQNEAKLLNINVSAVIAGWAQGQSLTQIATANGISEADLKTLLAGSKIDPEQRMQAEIAAMVSAGTITQDQATARLAVLAAEKTKRDAEIVAHKANGTTGTSTPGMFGGRGHGGERGPGAPHASTTPAAVTAS